jgi:hypothetical protein
MGITGVTGKRKNGGFSPPCIWRTRNFTNGEGATDGGDQENGPRSGRRAAGGGEVPLHGATERRRRARISRQNPGLAQDLAREAARARLPPLSLSLGGRARASAAAVLVLGGGVGGRSGRVTHVWQFDNWEAWPRGFRSTKLTGPTRQEHVALRLGP